jgi:hypothetical protein
LPCRAFFHFRGFFSVDRDKPAQTLNRLSHKRRYRLVTIAHKADVQRGHPHPVCCVIRLMNTTTRTLCLALAVALGTASAPAFADRGGHRGYYEGPRHDYRDHGYRDYGRRHDHRRAWVGPAAVLAITGLAIGAAAWAAQPAPPVYVAPAPAYVQPRPVYPAPAPAPAYSSYCASAGYYYPEVRYCPEGWQRVYP